MILLLLDVIFSSLTNLNTSFIIFDMVKKHTIIYILLISLLVTFLTQNIIYLFLIMIIYYLNKYYFSIIHNKYIMYFLSYLILYNINIDLNSFIIFIISVLFIYFNPYN